ncbi:hypothetical protein ANN_10732 [Periplaneta americana]|uniref:Reverse transcriptase domain-containing protein n=1 Tax=Periplaneta americana TaxID=6978 RepID=A0ABQ8T4R9_PERAM|nr:hypothetical protein ANN_10732 [Periplaneta americana]
MANIQRKNTVKIVFTTEAQRPSALEIHNWIDGTLHITEDQIDMIQLNTLERSVYIKLVSAVHYDRLLNKYTDPVNFQYDNGTIVKVALQRADVNTVTVRLFNLPPEIDDKTVVQSLSPYGAVRHVRSEVWRRKLLLSDVVRGGTSNVREPTRVTEGEAIIDESKQQNVDMIMEATVEEETDTSSETEMAKSVVPTTDHLTLGELDQPQDTEIEQEPTTRQATTDECMETTSVPTIVQPLHSPGELSSNTDCNNQEERSVGTPSKKLKQTQHDFPRDPRLRGRARYSSVCNIGEDQRGTAIIYRAGYTIQQSEIHPSGRLTTVLMGDNTLLINLYLHSGSNRRQEREDFISRDVPYYLSQRYEKLIIGGDFNCVLHCKDQTGTYNPSLALDRLTNDLHLIDVWEKLRGNDVQFTFHQGNSSSRIDRFYINRTMQTFLRRIEVHPVPFSDHDCVLMVLSRIHTAPQIGRSYWKLNSKLICDDEVMNEFSSWWETLSVRAERSKHTELRKWMYIYKPAIRSFFRNQGIMKAKDRKSKLQFYYNVIYDLYQQQCEGKDVTKHMNTVKIRLCKLQEDILKGSTVRCHTESIISGEKAALYHIACEKKRGQTKVMSNDQLRLEEDISETELKEAILTASSKSSPGPDGFNEGIIVLIPKIPKPQMITDYRPITLLNTDYKLFMKILANRIRPCMDHLIAPGQTCSVPGRTIINNLISIRDTIIQSSEMPMQKVAILNIDMEKAFDRVSQEYLFTVLEQFRFPRLIADSIQRLYRNAHSRIQINGYFTKPIPIQKSVRQGCPLSMILFTLCLEPLLRMIDRHLTLMPNPLGIPTVQAYADDISVICRNESQLGNLVDILILYCNATNARVNYKKSALLPLGEWNPAISIAHIPVRFEVRILGINFSPRLDDIIENNWQSTLNKLRGTLHQHLSRNLNLLQKVWHVNTFALSKLWYLAQVLPMPDKVSQKIEQLIGYYVWRGYPFRVARPQLRRKITEGGLNLIFVSIKCHSLLMKTIILAKNGIGHPQDIVFWRQFFQPSTSCRGTIGSHFRKTIKLMESLPNTVTSDITRINTKEIYHCLHQSLYEIPYIQQKFPNKNWLRIWTCFKWSNVPSEWKVTTYEVVNEIVPTEHKKYMCNMVLSPLCKRCGQIDTVRHRLTNCNAQVIQMWTWLRRHLQRIHRIDNPNDILRILLEMELPSAAHSYTSTWLTMGYIQYCMRSTTPSLQGLLTFLRGHHEHLKPNLRYKIQCIINR